MIIDKFFNSENNSFIVSAQIIELMLRKKKIKIDTLFHQLLLMNDEIDYDLVLEAIGILFLTGKIDYNMETDNMEITL